MSKTDASLVRKQIANRFGLTKTEFLNEERKLRSQTSSTPSTPSTPVIDQLAIDEDEVEEDMVRAAK